MAAAEFSLPSYLSRHIEVDYLSSSLIRLWATWGQELHYFSSFIFLVLKKDLGSEGDEWIYLELMKQNILV